MVGHLNIEKIAETEQEERFVALTRMEDSKWNFGGTKDEQEGEIGRVLLKIAPWAHRGRVLLKIAPWAHSNETNILTGMEQKSVRSQDCSGSQDQGVKKVKSEDYLGDHLKEFVAPKVEPKDLLEGMKVKSEVKVEVEEGRKERKCFFFDFGDVVEDEEDDVFMDAEPEDLQEIISGRKNISFMRFKGLMEHGHLKKEDLVMMKNARIVQISGKGEVIQFLTTKKTEFNKINLKELRLNDVIELGPFNKKSMYLMQTRFHKTIGELISKKGAMLKCNACQIDSADKMDVKNHIITEHADLIVKSGAYEHPQANVLIKRAITMFLKRVCDPRLLIESVVLTPQMRNQLRNQNQTQFNIYERAACLLANLIHPERTAVHCKICNVTFPASKRGGGKARWKCVQHLAHDHWTQYQDLAAQLNVAPGPRLDDLLLKVPCSYYKMFNAKFR